MANPGNRGWHSRKPKPNCRFAPFMSPPPRVGEGPGDHLRSPRAHSIPVVRAMSAGRPEHLGGSCMDRKQLVVERTRAVFGERLDDVLHMVRQDRQDLRGWEEPAHVRAVLRRSTVRAHSDNYGDTSVVAVTDTDFGRGAGEPEPGQQRECLGQVLEVAGNA